MASSATGKPSCSSDLRDRARAALRLVFDPSIADSLADAVGERDPEWLHRLVGSFRRAFARARWTHRLRRGAKDSNELALGVTTDANVDEALTLAFHLGLGIDTIRLSDVLDRDSRQVGEALYRARRVVDPTIPATCSRFHEALGRYDDRTLDADDRLGLLAHVQTCRGCAEVLERFRLLDDELRSDLAGYRDALPTLASGSTSRTRRAARSLATVGLGLALVGVLLGSALLLNRLSASPREPVPVVVGSGEADPQLEGWLVEVNREGALEAVNLKTSERRLMIESQEQFWTWPYLSPSNDTIAYQATGPGSESLLVFYTIAGERVGAVRWDDSESGRWPSGWLDNETFLFVELNQAESNGQTPANAENVERTLLGVDVSTGEERELYRGVFQWANPSPDGSMVALLTTYSGGSAGNSIELRAFTEGRLGPVINAIDERAITFGAWSFDSQRLFVSEIADQVIVPVPTPDPYTSGRSEPTWETTRIVALERDGGRQVIAEGGRGGWGQYVLGSSSGDDAVLFVTTEPLTDDVEPDQVPMERVTFWRTASGGGEPERLGEIETMSGLPQPFWSPDRNAVLLTVGQPFYLADRDPDTGSIYGQSVPPLIGTYILTPELGLVPRGVSLAQTRQLVAWLPEDALPSELGTPAQTFVETISAPEPVDALPEELRVSDRTSISADGRYLVLEDSELELPVFWDREEELARRMVSGVGDVSWVADDPVAIVSASVSRQDPSSRLTLFGEVPGSVSFSYGNQRWDPAGIGEDESRRYAVPLVSPDGTMTSFFVVDDDGTTELWIAGWQQETRRVASWSAPRDALPTVPPVAAWIDDTLLFTEPIDWDDGLPRRSVLTRMRWDDAEGDPVIEPLTELDGRGSDRGVAIVDLLPSPDGDEIAYRMRHYTQRAADRGRRDTIHVMSIQDATRSVEIARGTPGDGLSWSPDGEWLVAGLERRIVLLSPDGTTLDFLTGDDDAAYYPLWISPDEVWFAMDGQERAIWRVFVR